LTPFITGEEKVQTQNSYQMKEVCFILSKETLTPGFIRRSVNDVCQIVNDNLLKAGLLGVVKIVVWVFSANYVRKKRKGVHCPQSL